MPDKIEKELPKEDKVDTENKNIRMLTPEDLGVKTENILDKYNKEKNDIMEDVNDNDLKVGIEIEKEHIPTINKIKEYIEKNGGAFPPNELIQEWISLDHIKEHKNYYNDKNGLPAMERKLSEETFNDREHNGSNIKLEENKMELKDIEVNGKIYKGLSDGQNIYFNDIDAQELGIGTMEIKAEEYQYQRQVDIIKNDNKLKDALEEYIGGSGIFPENIDYPGFKENWAEIFTNEEIREMLSKAEGIEQFKSITCPECGMELQEKTCECGWNIDKEYNGIYDNKGEGE